MTAVLRPHPVPRGKHRNRILVLAGVFFLIGGESAADWLIMKDGQKTEVRGFAITARAVEVVTLTARRWSVIRDAVDVPATRAANGMSGDDPFSPSWPERPVPSTQEPSVHDTGPRIPLPRPGSAPKPLPERAAEPGPAPDRLPSRPRATLFVGGALATSPLEYGDTRRFELFRETARIETRYRDPAARGVELGASLRLIGPVGVAASVELFRNDRSAVIDALLPHPLFFDRARELVGSRPGLVYREDAYHLDGVVSTSLGSRLGIDLFAGPSYFVTKTEAVIDIFYLELFPFDSVTSIGTDVATYEDRPWGFNLGAGATYRLAGPLAAAFGMRYSRGRVRISLEDDRVLSFDAGGARITGGLRLLLP